MQTHYVECRGLDFSYRAMCYIRLYVIAKFQFFELYKQLRMSVNNARQFLPRYLRKPFKNEIVSVRFKDPVRTAQETLSATVIRTDRLML